ncbi:MAG: peptide ABC transporter substrate-binding protein [Eubacteriales bacterium]
MSAVLALVLAGGMTACGGSTSSVSGSAAAQESEASSIETGDDIMNIAFTDTVGTLNPLNMNWNFINLYATSMEFLPLVQFNSDYDVDYLIAESITSQDDRTFTVKIRDNATWSDGEPITADDVVWTMMKFTCPDVANPNFDFTPFVGINDDGTSPEGAESVEGIQAVDDRTVQLKTKDPMSLQTLYNNVLTWFCILPKHVLQDTPDDKLLTSSWFEKPDVVSGPYFVTDYDFSHYISYMANEKYFLGAPKIQKVNFRIMDSSEILTGLQTGEIDMVHPLSSLPNEDRKTVEKLDGYTSSYTDPITNEMTFFNTSKVTDPKVRQAIVYAIDRDTIVKQLLNGKGEVTDGFICSNSPYYDENKTKLSYDPDKAKQLLQEAGWDGSQTLQYYVSSNDSTAVKAAQLVQQYLGAVGVRIQINTVDFETLTGEVAGSDDEDFFSVQYTITPNDYWADEVSLINDKNGDGSWSGGYYNEDIDSLLAKTQTTTDADELKDIYDRIDEKVIEECPVFSLYFLSNLGVVSKRIKGADPTFYGAFDNIQDWEITA